MDIIFITVSIYINFHPLYHNKDQKIALKQAYMILEKRN